MRRAWNMARTLPGPSELFMLREADRLLIWDRWLAALSAERTGESGLLPAVAGGEGDSCAAWW